MDDKDIVPDFPSTVHWTDILFFVSTYYAHSAVQFLHNIYIPFIEVDFPDVDFRQTMSCLIDAFLFKLKILIFFGT